MLESRDTLATSRLAVATMVALALLGCVDSPTRPSGPITQGDVIEALFLGSGPALRDAVGNGCGIQGPGQWVSYGPGEMVDVVVASSVGEQHLPVIDATIDDLNQAIGGYFSLRAVSTDDPQPTPGSNQITVVEVSPEVQAAECGFVGTACFKCESGKLPLLDRCRVLVRNNLTFAPGTVHAHEIVHAVGLCHVSGRLTILRHALMASPQQGQSNALIPTEMDAIAAVYTSGLSPGARRPQFAAAGLVDP